MNFFQIISAIEEVDPDVYGRLDSRRRVFKHLAGMGQKMAAAAVPMVAASMLNKAYAQTPISASIADILNFALKLEYFEQYFYQSYSVQGGVASGLSFSTVNAAALRQIAGDEANHVAFLRSALGSAAIADPTRAAFNFAGSLNGTILFSDWATNSATFLALAQSFEDLGVRAYKGAAPIPALMNSKDTLTAALNIHSIEARHASHIRSMRRGGNYSSNSTPTLSAPGTLSTNPKSWISGNDGGGASPGKTDAIYAAGNNSSAPSGVTYDAETNTTQGGVALTNSNVPSSASNAFSEAFDEGLDVTSVAKIANLFSVSGSYFG